MTTKVDWEEVVVGLVFKAQNDEDALEELLDYIVELSQESYLKGKQNRG